MAEDHDVEGSASKSGGIPHDAKRQADLYWRQIEQLKAMAVCIRLTRAGPGLESFNWRRRRTIFPEGFEPAKDFIDQATAETRTYLLVTYEIEAKP